MCALQCDRRAGPAFAIDADKVLAALDGGKNGGAAHEQVRHCPTQNVSGSLNVLQEKRFSLPMIKAGGMDVLDHLKEGLLAPDLLINIRHLQRTSMAKTSLCSMHRPKARAPHRSHRDADQDRPFGMIRKNAPVVAQAWKRRTPQVRNVALRRATASAPRCWVLPQ